MKDEKNTYELPKEYFLKEVSSFLKGTGFNKYILNNDRERFLPDMFLKDSLKKERFKCTFIMETSSFQKNTLLQDPIIRDHLNNNEERPTITIEFDMSGKSYKNYIRSYKVNIPLSKGIAEILLSRFCQNSQKPFRRTRVHISVISYLTKSYILKKINSTKT